MTPPENWILTDSFGSLFNRLILTRGDRPHSGADGFSELIEHGRLYKTFFFKTKTTKSIPPIAIGQLLD
jgi:hypothetical protein